MAFCTRLSLGIFALSCAGSLLPLSPIHAQVAPSPVGFEASRASDVVFANPIAWHAVSCIGYEAGYRTFREDASASAQAQRQLDALAAETEIGPGALASVMRARKAEYHLLLGIVLTAEDPVADPPEPFAELLRLGQADCQEVERFRALDARRADTDIETTPADAPALRAVLRPDPEVERCVRRLTLVLSAMQSLLNRDEPLSDELLALYGFYTGGAELPAALIPGSNASPRAMAIYAARGPAPIIPDITEAELRQIAQIILEQPESSTRAHYVDLFAANTPHGSPLLFEAPVPAEGAVEAILAQAMGVGMGVQTQ